MRQWLLGGLPFGWWALAWLALKLCALVLFAWLLNRNARGWLDEHGSGSMPEDETTEVTPENFKRDPKMRL